MLKIQFIGNLTNNCEVKNFESGAHAIKFCAAVNQQVYKNGQYERQTIWIWCSLFRPDINKMQWLIDKLTKGARVYIEGSIEFSNYIDNDNKIRTSINCKVREIEVFTNVKTENGNGTYISSDHDDNGSVEIGSSSPEMINIQNPQEVLLEVTPEDLPF